MAIGNFRFIPLSGHGGVTDFAPVESNATIEKNVVEAVCGSLDEGCRVDSRTPLIYFATFLPYSIGTPFSQLNPNYHQTSTRSGWPLRLPHLPLALRSVQSFSLECKLLTSFTVFPQFPRDPRVSFSCYRGLNSLVHPPLRFSTFSRRGTRRPSQ